ncbi:MAG: phosphate ABC transporter permease subunit PstC [Oscillospiraceae bacterium]|nr:phosphate ABC transporter permease subunit PstC [Oscillospiraceae bacterium]
MKRKQGKESVIRISLLLCALAVVGYVLLICVYLILSGLPAIREVGLWNFLLGPLWAPTGSDTPQFGILPMILTSLYGTLAAIVLGIPIGICTALYLSKLASPRAAALLRPMIHLLAGIPSVVFGLIGMLVLLPALRRAFDLPAGDGLLASILVLAVMILPSVISLSDTALSAVPREYEEGSLALGATKMETFVHISIKAARSGLAAAVVLGIGRAIGETMAIVMVAGNVANMPSLFKSVRFLTTGIAIEMNYAAPGSLQRNALFSIGLILFIFILAINLILQLILRRGGKH